MWNVMAWLLFGAPFIITSMLTIRGVVKQRADVNPSHAQSRKEKVQPLTYDTHGPGLNNRHHTTDLKRGAKRSEHFRFIAVLLFCWAVLGLLGQLSDLKFLVDAIAWSISLTSISFKAVLLEIGKWISEAVTGYRDLVRGLGRLLLLPHLPPTFYDVLGIVSFSISRGTWLGRNRHRGFVEDATAKLEQANERLASINKKSTREEQLLELEKFQIIATEGMQTAFALRRRSTPVYHILYYTTAVGLVLLFLFGIDYVYRHFG